MQCDMLSSSPPRTAARIVLLCLLLLVPMGAFANFSAVLQGQSRGDTNWIAGNLRNWRELDYIPARVFFTGGPASNQVIRVDFEHLNKNIPGIQDLTLFTTSSNVVITSGPTLSAPLTSGTWTYSFTVTLSGTASGFVEFRARLLAGSHLNTGSSLGLSGTPALGSLQIFKPAAGPGLPDLAVVKTGPALAAPGDILTYTLNFTNKTTSTNFGIGVQVSDILPGAVTYVPNSASGSAAVVGNTIYWDLGDVLIGSHGGATYQVQVNAGVPYGLVFSNLAQILCAQDDLNPADNISSVATTVLFNRAPVAINDAYSLNEDTTLTIDSPGVLANDSDPDGNPLTISSPRPVSAPTHGTLTLNANGSFTYTPNPNFNGTDSFTYKATDGFNDSGLATVTLTVQPVNDPPVAVDDSYGVNKNTILSVPAPGVLCNDTDVDGDTLTAILFKLPSHGTLSLSSNGSFVYTPVSNYFGSDSFTYRASDGQAQTSPATVSITVHQVNSAPVAVNDTYTVYEDVALVTSMPGVLANDTDSDGDLMTPILISGPAHGTLTLDPNGSFRYLGTTNYFGTDSFSYKVNDGLLDSLPATVTINVQPVNDPPLAQNDSYTINEDTELLVPAPGVLANDSDVDGDSLSAILVSGPAHGTLTLNANGSLRYLAATNYNGPDSFTYKANDGTTDSPPATVSITVSPVNDAPVAVEDAYSVNEDSILTIAAPGVLANDSDVDGDVLTALLVGLPAHGSLTFSTNGSFIYTPAANYNGSDSFTYQATDGQTSSIPVTVTLTVNAVNDAPVAVNDSYTILEDTTLAIAAPGVLANDSDVDGDPLTAIVVSGPAHGTLTLNPDGSFQYLGATNYSGSDSFTYKANDGSADSLPATVSINVTAINHAPVAVADAYSLNEDEILTIAAPGVLANDSDMDGDALTADVVSLPAHGSLTVSSNGSFVYTPAANYNGYDSFTYQANDGQTVSTPVTVTFTVNAVNDAPVAVNDSYTINEDTALLVAAPGVLANDSDVDRDSLTAILLSGPAHGTLTLNADGSFQYLGATNYNGPDSFTYKANDGTADSAPVLVSITVNPVNDAPVAVNDSYTVNEDTALVIAAAGVLANDSDVDGDSLSAILVSGPAHGTLTLNANGSLRYLAATNYNGPDSFTYKANDGTADSAPATVSITVSPVNDAPVAVADAYSVNEDSILTIAAPGVLANDSDVDGDVLTAQVLSLPAHGSLTFSTNGSFVYTPATNYNRSEERRV